MMTNIFKKVVITVAFVILCFLSKEFTVQGAEKDIDYSSPGVQAFSEWIEAMKGNNIGKAWNLMAEIAQQLAGNDINEFKNWLNTIDPSPIKDLAESKIMDVTTLSPQKILILYSSSRGLRASYVVETSGEWKICPLGSLMGRVKFDMAILRKAIEAYYDDNNKFPVSLNDLIAPIPYIKELPPDPFRSAGGSYVYMSAAIVCELYSFGPDGDDDHGLFQYDSRNALVSNGDIILRFGIPGFKR